MKTTVEVKVNLKSSKNSENLSGGMLAKRKSDLLRIGEIAARAGVAPSALRFYEEQGLVLPERNESGIRIYARSALRRIAFIRAAQRIGLSLDEIRAALESLPEGRTPTRADWAALSASWKPNLDKKIAELESLRDDLTSCIGCGCLSLQRCALYNPEDIEGTAGPGARLWKACGPFTEAPSADASTGTLH